MSAATVDALFGAAVLQTSPWSLFNHAWTAVKGYSADEFQFIEGKTPMSTFKETGLMIAFYYLTIYTGWRWMKNREAFKLSTLFKIHNLLLTAVSGALLALFLEQLIPSLWNNGLYKCICSKPGWTDKLVVLYYLNYLTKYVELLDTVFLVLKKKPLTFLHTYHHGATAFLCWTQLVGKTPVSWVPITLNLTVHVVMYWYYFQSARGVRVTWKEWITRLQIAQFVLDLGFVFFATWDFHADEWGLETMHIGRCEGSLFAAITGCVTLSSYLVLFILFYIATYRKSSRRGRKGLGLKKDQVVTASGRAAETLKSARSRFGQSSIESIESTTKTQWAVSRD